jgi:glutathionylspermidine synthase
MTVGPESLPEVRLVPIPAAEYGAFRRQVIFSCCKWDPQVGDVNTVADCVAVLSAAAARRLSAWAEALAAETLAAEAELARRPDLWRELGLPGPVCRALLEAAGRHHTAGVRVMRFDLHPTHGGWAVSEVNSDVPGGFAESSALARLASRFVPGAVACGDVAAALAAGFAAALGPGARVALVHATSYADDRQVMQFLGEALAARGLVPLLLAPDHLRWPDGRARSIAREQEGDVAGVVRFFPVEWLPLLPRASDWRGYFRHSVPCCNHATAVLTQSKRLPLLWDRLGVAAPTWRQLLPETHDPRQVDWRHDRDWLLKPALGRVGEAVTIPEVTPPAEWRRIAWSARFFPRAWVAQRRFASRPLASARGERHLVTGVFTVDGRAAGFYGRLADRPRIDQYAQDVAVVVQEQTERTDGHDA